MTLSVFIADDETPARERLKELLADLAPELPTRVVGEAGNGVEVLERQRDSGAQVLLLDIEMPLIGGLDVARHLAGTSGCPAIVFVTAHDRHAVEAFELNALDYLMKPVRAERLATALRKALARGAPDTESIARAAGGAARSQLPVSERNRIVLVPAADIVYLKAEQKYVTLRTRARTHLIEEPLIALEREFHDRFIRIHRNCLVARDAIRGFERVAGTESDAHWEVVLDGLEERLPVSRRQWSAVREIAEKGGAEA